MKNPEYNVQYQSSEFLTVIIDFSAKRPVYIKMNTSNVSNVSQIGSVCAEKSRHEQRQRQQRQHLRPPIDHKLTARHARH